MPVAVSGGGRASDIATGRVQELHALLVEQAGLVSQLLSVARQKTAVILEQDTAGIQEATAAESRLVQEIQAVEAQREAWVAGWAREHGVEPQGRGVTLSDVLARLPESDAAPLQKAAETLAGVLNELLRVNGENADLLYYSLAHVQTLLDALAGEPASHGVYGPDRRRADAQPRALMDWRV